MIARAESAIYLKPALSSWRRRRSAIPVEHINRQGRIVHLAYSLLGSREAAILFLNSDNAELGGTPLILAGQSIDGYVAVQNEVRHMASILTGERP